MSIRERIEQVVDAALQADHRTVPGLSKYDKTTALAAAREMALIIKEQMQNESRVIGRIIGLERNGPRRP